jgi:hypothetical protein
MKAKMTGRDEHVVSLYCSACGSNVGTTGIYDDNWRAVCHECGMNLNPRVTVAVPSTNYNFDSIGVETAQEVIVSYWNRSMRYGFRLGDRIAIACPMFRLDIEDIAAEDVLDTEFNHFEYEDTDGESPKQFAHGFTASRVAHDYVHKNLQTWALDKMCEQAGVDWQQYQAYRVITLEHKFYTHAHGDVDITDRNFLSHVIRYYDVPFDCDWMVEAYESVDAVLDDLEENYGYWKERSASWMADKGIKGFETEDEALAFIEEKEAREEEALDRIDEILENDGWEPAVGHDMGLEHPLSR